MFSRSAPMQPVNPTTNVIAPPHIKINAGSNAIVVIRDRLLNISFSHHAQKPTIRIHKPITCRIFKLLIYKSTQSNTLHKRNVPRTWRLHWISHIWGSSWFRWCPVDKTFESVSYCYWIHFVWPRELLRLSLLAEAFYHYCLQWSLPTTKQEWDAALWIACIDFRLLLKSKLSRWWNGGITPLL